MSCILKFEFTKSYINNELIPWINQKDKIESSDIIEEYQVGLIIKHQKLIKILTPFFVYIPYAKCSILNTDHTLSLVSYCYYTRVATYTISNKNVKKYINSNMLNMNLNNITNTTLKLANKSIINLQDPDISFENITNDNIYPFIWLKTELNEQYREDIIPGMHVYSNNKLIGIIYNIIDNKIYIIPNITLRLNLSICKLYNVFIKIDENQIITNTYTQQLKPNDKIISINNNQLNTESMIYSDEMKLYIPLNTYFWYYSIHSSQIKLTIIRNHKQLTLNIKPEQLDKKVSFNTESTTNYKLINNIILAKGNLLMIDWLVYNEIVFCNEMYKNFKINPFNRYRNNYLFMGIIEIEKHPEHIIKTLQSYNKNIQKYMDSMDIIQINNKKIFNLNKLDTIMHLVLIDPANKELILDWCY